MKPAALLGIALLLAVPGPARAGTLELRIEADPRPARGAAWRIEIAAEGRPPADRLILYWAADGAPRFQSRVVEEPAPGLFRVHLPGAETDVSGLRLYAEAWDRAGRRVGELGSAERPLHFETDPGHAGQLLLGAALGGGLVAAVLGLGLLREARRRRRLLDQLFWVVTLRPFVHLDEVEADRQIMHLAGRELCHPVLGTRRFPVRELRRRFARIRSESPERLLGGDLLGYRSLLADVSRSHA